MDTKLPGASTPDCAKLAALTTPPEFTCGGSAFGFNLPETEMLPCRFCSGICAVTPMDVCAADVLRGCHVALQVPSLSDMSESGGSPFVKFAVTDPLVIALPQSSTTFAVSAVGHAAGTLKSCPMLEISGSSLVGAHPPASRALDDPPPPAVSTSSTLTRRADPSLKSSVITPRRTPAVSPVIFGCTTTVAGPSVGTAPVGGSACSHVPPSSVSVPDTYASAVFAGLPMRKFCELGGLPPAAPVKIRLVG